MTKKRVLSMFLVVIMAVLLLLPTTAMAATNRLTLTSSTIRIETRNGSAVLVDGKKEHILTPDTILVINRNTKFYLENSEPAYIHAIDGAGKRDVEFRNRGSKYPATGTLVINNTTGAYGIHSGDLRLEANVEVHTTGLTAGAYASDKIYVNPGHLYATGSDFGVYGHGNQVEVRHDGRLEAVATGVNGIGVFGADKGISVKADRGGTIIGEGEICGIYGADKVYAADGGLIHGICRDINTSLSAVYAPRAIKAYHENHTLKEGQGTILEQYPNANLLITDEPLVINQQYPAVGRNMRNLENYDWYTEPTNVVGVQDGGLVGTEHFGKGMQLVGVRDYDKTLRKKAQENVELTKQPSRHMVVFGEVEVRLAVEVVVEHYVGIRGDEDSFQLAGTTSHWVDPDQTLDSAQLAEFKTDITALDPQYIGAVFMNERTYPSELPLSDTEPNVVKLYYAATTNAQVVVKVEQNIGMGDYVDYHVVPYNDIEVGTPIDSSSLRFQMEDELGFDYLFNRYEPDFLIYTAINPDDNTIIIYFDYYGL